MGFAPNKGTDNHLIRAYRKVNNMNEVTTEKDNDPIKKFQENVVGQIRDKIGGLMPDEMIKKIVEDGIQAELYKPTREPGKDYGSWNSPPLQPFIQVEIAQLIRPKLKTLVEEVMAEKQDMLEKAVEEFVKDQLPKMFIEIVTAFFQSNAQHNSMRVEVNIVERLRSKGIFI